MDFSNHHVRDLPEHQLPHVPERAVGEVHLIAPEIETNDLHQNNDWTSPPTQDDSDTDIDTDTQFFYHAVTVLQDAGSLATHVASSVIHREAASVNQRLLQVQDRLHRQKRRRLGTAGDAEDSSSSIAISIATKPEELDRTITHTSSTSSAVSEQESLSIWNQAARTKRISILLRDLEMTQSLLLREIAAASIAASSTIVADGPPSY
jgi:hypothetical protein